MCANGAIFNLSSAKAVQRPLGWTSADAAGMPITAGLITVTDIRTGKINHAMRMTSPVMRAAYQYPASHLVTLSDQPATALPWMGVRARLRKTYDCSALATRPGTSSEGFNSVPALRTVLALWLVDTGRATVVLLHNFASLMLVCSREWLGRRSLHGLGCCAFRCTPLADGCYWSTILGWLPVDGCTWPSTCT